MLNYFVKLILFISLVSASFASTLPLEQFDSDILLSLERIKLQNEILHKQYEDLKEIESSIDPEHNEAIIDSITQKVLSDIESNSNYQKNSAWGEVKELVHHISDEAKVLSRKNGLAISIIIMTIELTEIPMKALAVSIGSPVLVVLYEVLQPGILIPTIIIGIKNIAQTAKAKRLFNNKALYKEWRSSEKEVQKQLSFKKGKNQISYELGEHNYIVDNSNLLTDTLRIIGFNKGRLDYKNIRIFLRKKDIQSVEIESIKDANLNKQLKAKLILDQLTVLGYNEELHSTFKRARVDLKPRALNQELSKWIHDLFNSQSSEKTIELFNNLPLSVSPLIFFELWETKIMEEFFAFNKQFKRKYYRKLQTKLLPIVIGLRKDALLSGANPQWTSELEDFSGSYFKSILE